jgi:hypothetical protein
VAANWASLEPSVAKRIVVGKMLIGFPPCPKLSSLIRMMPADDPRRPGRRAIHRSAWKGYSPKFGLFLKQERPPTRAIRK